MKINAPKHARQVVIQMANAYVPIPAQIPAMKQENV
jgi:hypothetical protein